MSEASVARFYDDFSADYHLIYPDWEAGTVRQGRSLDALVRREFGAGSRDVLDCSCGIGTQAIGLARLGHRVTGSDLSAGAVARAAREAAARGLQLPVAVADMRALPFDAGRFDVVVCADNSLPHLLTPAEVRTALAGMRRVLRPGGLLLVSTRPYDELRAARPASTPPQVSGSGADRHITFQLWDWHADGERYDLEMYQLLPEGGGWQVRVRRATYWALTRQQLADLAAEAGLTDIRWELPDDTGFFQPVMIARSGVR
jgi:SAM-dependent methyltransferase